MKYDVEVDINRLKKDAELLMSKSEEFKQEFGKLTSLMEDLNKMWTGQAKDTFQSQINNEISECRETIDTVNSLIQGMNDAVSEYEKCEADVGSYISRVRV